MPKSNTNKKRTKVPQQNTRDDSLPTEIKSRIKQFKEMFPQYRHSTDDDILSIFDEFNNDYNAAVYGVSCGLVQTKPSETWQTAGQKKKTKKPARGKSVTPKNTRNEEKRTSYPSRGQSASRASRSRGGKSSTYSTRTSTNAPKDTRPPPTSKTSQAPLESNRPESSTPSQKSTPPPNPEPVRVAKPKLSSTPVTEHLSYANAAKSRVRWSPAKIEPSTSAKDAQKISPVAPPFQQPSASASAPAPVSSIPPNVQSNSPIPSSTAAPTTVNTPSMNNLPGSTVNPFGIPSSGERSGVLLPGNFRSDDSMSFQFGNLGLVEEEQNSAASKDSEQPKASTNVSAKATKSNETPPNVSSSKPQQTVQNEEPNMVSGVPMNQYSHYPPMYQMDPVSMDPSAPRGPMAYYPEAQYQQHYQRDGKYPRAGANSPNYPRSESGQQSSGKFNGESNGKGSATANTTQNANANANANGTATAAAAQTPAYPYTPGPYPMYGHPFVPNHSFPAGSYGNQAFYGFYKHQGFPGYQNFGNNQMGYTQGEGERPYYPGQEGGNPPPASSSAGGASGSKSSANRESSKSSTSQSATALEGSQYNPDAFKNQPMDYYQDMYMNTSFMNPQPFAYPHMGQQNYPLHPQPTNAQSSSQQPSSTNQNPTY